MRIWVNIQPSACMPLNVVVYMRFYTCCIWTMTKPVCLTESVSIGINVAPVIMWTLIRDRKLVHSQSTELSLDLVVRDGGLFGGGSTGNSLSCSWSSDHLESHSQRNPIIRNSHFKIQSLSNSFVLILADMQSCLPSTQSQTYNAGLNHRNR